MILPKLKSTALIAVFFALFIFVQGVSASDQFDVDVNVEYKVQDTGTTHVTHDVILTNLLDEYYAKSYILTLDNMDPQGVEANAGGENINVSKTVSGNSVSLKVQFADSVLGKGNTRRFKIEFDEPNFVTKTGEVWEISIPRISDVKSFGEYSVSLVVPSQFGQEAYLSPDPKLEGKSGSNYFYRFDKDQVAGAGISAGFGEFQVFSFNLKYHLGNSLSLGSVSQIALPPDTNYQKVYYENIDPKPANIHTDPDGNWIADYNLSPGQRIDIAVRGVVQLFSEPRDDIPKTSGEVLSRNLVPSTYWQIDNPEIVRLAKSLKTPRAIYDFVVNTLSYDYNRVSPSVVRRGAVEALNYPSNAICMEFTDLFVALSRAAGIPAREVNGFAYTENPSIEPLSLVADVLHAWPEYWDSERAIWVPVDPTWGNTTGGVNFFNKLDLRHFVFVIHGEDAVLPYPAGSYKSGAPEKDVFVNFGNLPADRVQKTDITAQIMNKIPFLPPKVVLTINNSGSSAVYNIKPAIYFDDKLEKEEFVESLLPYSSDKIEVAIPFSFLALGTPDNIKVFAGKSYLSVPTDKTRAVIYNLVAIVVIITFAVLLVSIRSKKVRIFHGIPFIKNKSSKS